jgi:hypothetical protein
LLEHTKRASGEVQRSEHLSHWQSRLSSASAVATFCLEVSAAGAGAASCWWSCAGADIMRGLGVRCGTEGGGESQSAVDSLRSVTLHPDSGGVCDISCWTWIWLPKGCRQRSRSRKSRIGLQTRPDRGPGKVRGLGFTCTSAERNWRSWHH